MSKMKTYSELEDMVRKYRDRTIERIDEKVDEIINILDSRENLSPVEIEEKKKKLEDIFEELTDIDLDWADVEYEIEEYLDKVEDLQVRWIALCEIWDEKGPLFTCSPGDEDVWFDRMIGKYFSRRGLDFLEYRGDIGSTYIKVKGRRLQNGEVISPENMARDLS